MTTQQKPTNSGFNAFSTTANVINGISLIGKVAIVTGGYSGLGLETIRTLALSGAHIIVPARDVNRAREAINNVANAEVWELDLLNSISIKRFVKRFLNSGLPLDILINNAGIMALPKKH